MSNQQRPDRVLGAEAALDARLRAIVAASPLFRAIWDRWDAIALPGCWVSGSAIAQTVWNAAFGFPPDHGLADIDLVYFDAADMSERREMREAERVRGLFPDLPLAIDIKNEARVHLWYESKFGYPIPPYRSIEHAITTFPTTASSVAIRPGADYLEIFAPFGLADMFGGMVRANKVQITQDIYEQKARRWHGCWPALTIIGWDDEGWRGPSCFEG